MDNFESDEGQVDGCGSLFLAKYAKKYHGQIRKVVRKYSKRQGYIVH